MSWKCRLLGHDWVYKTDTKLCLRCKIEGENEREQRHGDEDAEIGEQRLSITDTDNGYLITTEEYTRTASGPDSEYYDWFPVSRIRFSEKELREIMEVIDDHDSD